MIILFLKKVANNLAVPFFFLKKKTLFYMMKRTKNTIFLKNIIFIVLIIHIKMVLIDR